MNSENLEWGTWTTNYRSAFVWQCSYSLVVYKEPINWLLYNYEVSYKFNMAYRLAYMGWEVMVSLINTTNMHLTWILYGLITQWGVWNVLNKSSDNIE